MENLRISAEHKSYIVYWLVKKDKQSEVNKY